MRVGIRKAIFSQLVRDIPWGSTQKVRSQNVYKVVVDLIAEQDAEKAYAQICDTFTIKVKNQQTGFTDFLRAKNIDEWFAGDHYSLFRTKEDVRRWYAENHAISEMEAATSWLESEGYIIVTKSVERIGYRLFFSITPKGWSVAHLYR